MKVKPTDKSWKDMMRIVRGLGFQTFQGKKHTKVKDKEGRFVTLIPRHNRLKKGTVISIIEALKEAGADIELEH